MLPVKTDLTSIKEALIDGRSPFVGNENDPRRVQTVADPLTNTLARHRITIARHADQAGAKDTDGVFGVIIKEPSALALPHAPEHEPSWKLLGQCTDGARVSELEN